MLNALEIDPENLRDPRPAVEAFVDDAIKNQLALRVTRSVYPEWLVCRNPLFTGVNIHQY